MKKTWKIIVSILLVLLFGIGAFLFLPKLQRHWGIRKAEQILERPLPVPVIPNDVENPAQKIPISVNLPVPFTPQAPHGDWSLPFQEACEEASALMAIRYSFGTDFLGPNDAEAGILDLVKTNEEILGLPIDQTIEQLKALILEIDPAIPVHVLLDPSVQNLKQELAKGNVIIVPAAGRKLGNPFYQQPGPLYHMLVLRGYTEDGLFITNDPGTRRGEAYLYPFDVIMEAMGDWNDGDPDHGEKVVLMMGRMEEGNGK